MSKSKTKFNSKLSLGKYEICNIRCYKYISDVSTFCLEIESSVQLSYPYSKIENILHIISSIFICVIMFKTHNIRKKQHIYILFCVVFYLSLKNTLKDVVLMTHLLYFKKQEAYASSPHVYLLYVYSIYMSLS